MSGQTIGARRHKRFGVVVVLERYPLFSTRKNDQQIGYIEGSDAFDLSGKPRCHYNVATGNLRDLDSNKLVGFVSSEGKVAGVSWIIEKLFPTSDELAAIENSVEDRNGPIPNEMERVFEMLRDRIGLK